MNRPIFGIYAPVTTPFTDDKVDLDRLRENIIKYRETPLAGFFALGSNGETAGLDHEEKLLILKTIIKEKAKNQTVLAGTGAESTYSTIIYTKEAADAGADYALIISPSYFKKLLTEEALYSFYSEVADNSSIPILIYHAPIYTGVTISNRLLEKLAKHENIIGIKDSSPGQIVQFPSLYKSGFYILSGTINFLYPALALGAAGGVVSLADSFPKVCIDIFEVIQKRDWENSRLLHHKLVQLNKSISGSFGVAGVKYAMDVAGYFGGLPRRPILPLRDSEKEQIKKAIAEVGLFESEKIR